MQLLDIAEGTRFQDTLTILNAQHNKLRENQIRGLVDSKEVTRSENVITNGLLQILADMEDELPIFDPPYTDQPSGGTPPSGPPNNGGEPPLKMMAKVCLGRKILVQREMMAQEQRQGLLPTTSSPPSPDSA